MAKLLKVSFLIKTLVLLLFLDNSAYTNKYPAYKYEDRIKSAFDRAEYKTVLSICEKGLPLRPNSIIMLNLCGKSNFILTKYKESQKQFLKLLYIARLQNDSSVIAVALNNIGEIYRVEKKWKKAYKNYSVAIQINDKNPTELARNMYNIAKMYRDQKKFSDALRYLNKVLKINSKDSITKSLSHNEMGIIYELQKDYKKAATAYNDSISILEKENIAFYLGVVYGNLGRMSLLEKNYEKALLNLEKAVGYGRQAKDNNGLIKRLRHLAFYYIIQKDYKKTSAYLEEVIAIKKELGNKDIEAEEKILLYLREVL